MADADYYLTMDGVKGESTKPADAMQILTFDWGVTQSGSAAIGSGLTTGKAKLEDFTFTIANGSASPQLMLLCATGKPVAKAKLECRKSGGDPQNYLVVDFEELIISSFKTNGPGGDVSTPTETVTFNFTKIAVDYLKQDAKGNTASAAKMKFDVKSGIGSK